MSITDRRTTRVGDVHAGRMPQVILDSRSGRTLELHHPLSGFDFWDPPFFDMNNDDLVRISGEIFEWSDLYAHDREELLASQLSINAIDKELDLRTESGVGDTRLGRIHNWGSISERRFGREPLHQSDWENTGSVSDSSFDLPQRRRHAGNASRPRPRYSWRHEGRPRADSLSRNDSFGASSGRPRRQPNRSTQAEATQGSALATRGQQAGGGSGRSRRFQQRHPRASLADQAASQAESNEQQPGPSS